MNKLFLCLLSFTVYNALYCASDKGLIEINGQKKSIVEHISDARISTLLGPENPFVNTDVFLYEEKGFTQVGNVLTVTQDIITKMDLGNYIYTPSYPTRIQSNPGEYKERGAIIVGTKDQTVADKLHLVMMHVLMQSMKQS